jgi:PAP2 superfamily
MKRIRVSPTRADRSVARAIALHTDRPAEDVAGIITWGADEHILCAAAAGWWAYTRNRSRRERRAADHVLLTTIVAAALPHLLKTVFEQERPDRETVEAHLYGVPFSGRRLDAFPSGHAVHIGALASAAGQLPHRQRNLVWATGAALVLTRVVLLAHWASDVAAGLALGVLTERLMRYVTGFGRRRK